MIAERPFADGRRTVVFVFSELRADAGRLTADWLWRLRTFDDAGWATHAALINKDPALVATAKTLVADGRFPAGTALHHFALRDRRVRPSWYGALPEGETLAHRIGDWLDWLTAQVPGALVVADSPATYPYVARMTNPVVARLAALHRPHLSAAGGGDPDPATAPLSQVFAERDFDEHQAQFDAFVTMTARQAEDLRARYGQDTPVHVIPPAVAPPSSDRPAAATIPRRIVGVGPLEATSRHADAIRAFALVAAAHPDAVLELVGTGELAGELTAMTMEAGVANRVRIRPPGAEDPFAGATLSLWTGRRDACPPAIARALLAGVPVLAYDVRYGPRELLAAFGGSEHAEVGDLIADGDIGALARAMSRRLAAAPPAFADETPLTDPDAVARRWTRLAEGLADAACDHRTPTLLVDSMSTNARIIRVPGVLADAATSLTTWSCDLPGLVEPAGWLSPPTVPTPDQAAEAAEDDEPPVHPHAAGPTRELFAQLRSPSLAFAAVETGDEFRVEFSDGSTTVPLLATGFSERIIASRIGNATLRRHPDGTVWVGPRHELLYATNVDGRLLVRTSPDEPPSDVTHALDWVVDIDWADLSVTDEGVSFMGSLRATWIAPADDSPPDICVPDVGGFSRTIGQLHYTGEPVVDATTWTAPVAGRFDTDPLVATTALARRALPLHVGFRGLLLPIGGLWTHGERARIQLRCERGAVTLLPSPGGRVLAAPGRGLRARTSGAVRTLVGRG